jgi:hypothetical protein
MLLDTTKETARVEGAGPALGVALVTGGRRGIGARDLRGIGASWL